MRLHWYLSKCSFPCRPQMNKKSSKLRKGSAQFPQISVELFIRVDGQVPLHWKSRGPYQGYEGCSSLPSLAGPVPYLWLVGRRKELFRPVALWERVGGEKFCPSSLLGSEKETSLSPDRWETQENHTWTSKHWEKGGKPCILTGLVAPVQSPLCPCKKEADLLWESREHRRGPKWRC